VLAAGAAGPALAGAVLLLLAGRARCGLAPVRRGQRLPQARGLPLPFGQLVVSLRALGPRAVLAWVPGGALVALTGVAISNNDLPADQVDLFRRLGASLGVTSAALLLATRLIARRPPWAWSRSLPWSSLRRTAADGALLALFASPFLVLVRSLRPGSGLAVSLLLLFLAARLPGRMRTPVQGKTKLGAWSWYESGLLALLVTIVPLAGIALGFLAPLALWASARRDRDQKVGLFLERRFDPAGEGTA